MRGTAAAPSGVLGGGIVSCTNEDVVVELKKLSSCKQLSAAIAAQ